MLFVVHFQQGKEERCLRKADSSPCDKRGRRSFAEPRTPALGNDLSILGATCPSWERRAEREGVRRQIPPSDAQKPPYCRKRFYSRCAIWSHWETKLFLSPSITEGRNLPACERHLKFLNFRPVPWPELKPRPRRQYPVARRITLLPWRGQRFQQHGHQLKLLTTKAQDLTKP